MNGSNVITEPMISDAPACKTDEPTYDLSYPEDVLILVDESEISLSCTWRSVGLEIVEVDIQGSASEPAGAASYELSEGSGLEYCLESMIWPPPRWGFYVVEGVTANYYRGDGWETDDDMDFEFDLMRPATVEEMAGFYGFNFWDSAA